MANQTRSGLKQTLLQYQAPILTLALVLGAVFADARYKAMHPPFATGLLHLETGRWEDAIESLSTVLRANPADASARVAIGRAYLGLGRAEEARKHFEMAEKSASDSLKAARENLGLR